MYNVRVLCSRGEYSNRTHGSELERQRVLWRHYGRTLANVFLQDGTNVNHELVKGGWCWWYRKYVPGNTELETLEKDARDSKKGLWADPQPMPPWEWRKQCE